MSGDNADWLAIQQEVRARVGREVSRAGGGDRVSSSGDGFWVAESEAAADRIRVPYEDALWDYRQGLNWDPRMPDQPEYLENYRRGWRAGEQERADWERGDD